MLSFFIQTKPVSVAFPLYCSDVHNQVPVNIKIDLNNSFYLYNFDDRPVAIFYRLQPSGYAIYDFTYGTVIEFSHSDIECFTDSKCKYYYQGAFSYYQLEDDHFTHLITGYSIIPGRFYNFTASDFYWWGTWKRFFFS